MPRDQIFTLGQINDCFSAPYKIDTFRQSLTSDRKKEDSAALVEIEEKFKMSPGKTEGRNDDMKPPKYLAAKASYEKLI